METINAAKFRSEFLQVLRSRRASEDVTSRKLGRTGEQGRLPVLILSINESSHQRKPFVVFLHGTHKCKEWLRPLLEVWDLIKLADYLTQREDIDPSKIGITGESLGGMHAWFAAAVDTRYAVAVPIIGVQTMTSGTVGVDSIKAVFEGPFVNVCITDSLWDACHSKSAIDKEVVEQVWIRIAPGLASKFDSTYSIPIIAPRPLLILNGEKDPRCPIEGLEIPKSRACKAYEDAHCPDNFKVIAQPGIGHEMTPLMGKEASDWFDTFLK
ncbi:hypothetical protein ACSBR2_012666 [Camellia fascicularis]